MKVRDQWLKRPSLNSLITLLKRSTHSSCFAVAATPAAQGGEASPHLQPQRHQTGPRVGAKCPSKLGWSSTHRPPLGEEGNWVRLPAYWVWTPSPSSTTSPHIAFCPPLHATTGPNSYHSSIPVSSATLFSLPSVCHLPHSPCSIDWAI